MEVKRSINLILKVEHRVFFMLRESEPIINILKSLKNGIDILLIDGHGILHPRRCGLACYVGVIIDRPTIGVAKSLLCGIVRENNFIDVDGVTSGRKKKPLYVSVGHKINLIDAIEIVKQLVKPKERIPWPLRLPNIRSKVLATSSIS